MIISLYKNKRREEKKEKMNKKKEETKEGIKEKKDRKNEKKGKKYEKRNTCIKIIKSGDRCSKVAKSLFTKTGVNKWQCQYCDLTCNDNSNLNRHIKRKHKNCQFQINDVSKDVESGRRCMYVH